LLVILSGSAAPEGNYAEDRGKPGSEPSPVPQTTPVPATTTVQATVAPTVNAAAMPASIQ
jgi:hypothetical protein